MLVKLGQAGLMQGAELSSLPPFDMTNMALWNDGADTSTITEVANRASQWDDKSGESNHTTQGTGSLQFLTNTNVVNGLNVLTAGNGAGTKLTNMNFHSNLYDLTLGDFTIIIAKKMRHFSAANGYPHLLKGGVSGGHMTSRQDWYNGMNAAQFVTDTWGQSNFPAAEDTVARISSFRRQGTYAKSNIDGIEGATHNNSTKVLNATLTSLRLGGGTWVGEAWDGDLLEIMMFREMLSDIRMNEIGNYFTSKWGTAWTSI